MSLSEDLLNIRITRASAWLQRYASDKPLNVLVGLGKRTEFTLTCSEHGSFPWSWHRIKEHGALLPCPGCRLEARLGKALTTINEAILSHSANATREVRRAAAAAELQAKLDERWGAGVARLDPASYTTRDEHCSVTCLVDPDHPPFQATPRSLLRTRHEGCLPHCCPACIEDAANVAPGQGSLTRQPGGYLYRIVHLPTGRRYVGITSQTPEIRYARHLRDAAEQLRSTELSILLGKNPEHFVMEPIAYYFKRTDLKAAEVAAIVEQGSRFPAGFNLTDGGELPPAQRRSMLDQRIATVIASACLSDEDADALYPALAARLTRRRSSAPKLIRELQRPGQLEKLLQLSQEPSVEVFTGQSSHPVAVGGSPPLGRAIPCEVSGKRYSSFAAMCKAHSVESRTVRDRLRRGVSLEAALIPPAAKPDDTKSLGSICAAHGLPLAVVQRALAKGITLPEALRTLTLQKESPGLWEAAKFLKLPVGMARLAIDEWTPELEHPVLTRNSKGQLNVDAWPRFIRECLVYLALNPGEPLSATFGASSWLMKKQREFRSRYAQGDLRPEYACVVERIPGFVPANGLSAPRSTEDALRAIAVEANTRYCAEMSKHAIAKTLGMDYKAFRSRLRRAQAAGTPATATPA